MPSPTLLKFAEEKRDGLLDCPFLTFPFPLARISHTPSTAVPLHPPCLLFAQQVLSGRRLRLLATRQCEKSGLARRLHPEGEGNTVGQVALGSDQDYVQKESIRKPFLSQEIQIGLTNGGRLQSDLLRKAQYGSSLLVDTGLSPVLLELLQQFAVVSDVGEQLLPMRPSSVVTAVG